jgi:inosose dehydratase
MLTRRDFVAAIGAAAARVLDLQGAAAAVRIGYSAITWQGDDRQAIDDIASAGYQGIQLRTSAVDAFGSKPEALRALLASRALTFVALSSGNLGIDPTGGTAERGRHLDRARFLRDAGGTFLQIIDSRPPDRPIVETDYARLGGLLSDLGRRVREMGVTLVYHHHMNSIGEKPAAIRSIMAQTDPACVKMLFDTAHYQQGGGDPVQGLHAYRDRIAVLHLKDLEARQPGATGDVSRSYRFVELGRGNVDLPAVIVAMHQIRFRGWTIVELDRVPDAERTPRESAIISRDYLEERGIRVRR